VIILENLQNSHEFLPGIFEDRRFQGIPILEFQVALVEALDNAGVDNKVQEK